MGIQSRLFVGAQFASGRSGEEILSELRRRINNDPAAELEEAKRELRKIALMRLRGLVTA